MSTVQGGQQAPSQAPHPLSGPEPPRQVRLTRKMREAIQLLQNAIGTPQEERAKRRARLALAGDYENWYGAKRNRLRRRRVAARLARAARRVSRGSRKAGGGGARPKTERKRVGQVR